MTTYRVENMTCGHCVRTVEAAVHAVDATAVVDVDLAAGLVRVDGDEADPQRVVLAIRAAGYPTSRVDGNAGTIEVVETAPARRGCCCG